VDPLESNDTATVTVPSSSSMPTKAKDLQAFSAKWILKTSETRYLTRKATLGIVHDVSDLVEVVSQSLQDQVQSILHSNGIDHAVTSQVNEVFDGCTSKPFEGVTSFYQQLQHYRNHFGLIVS